MQSSIAAPSRALLEALHPARKRPICECLKIAQSKHRSNTILRRNVSTTSSRLSEMEVEGEPRRWAQTPPAMKAPFQIKSRPATWAPFECNSDPRKLDEAYNNFLGPSGSTLLTDETKWLAVTHKSFDHGRRGFNDRLAFLGKRIIELQLSISLLNSASSSKYLKEYEDPHGRIPFQHPAIQNVELLAGNAKDFFMHHKEIARVAKEYNIPSVVRWQPKDPKRLSESGCDMVYTQAIFAIIGGIALERGNGVTNKIVRERLLQPLGVNMAGSGRLNVA